MTIYDVEMSCEVNSVKDENNVEIRSSQLGNHARASQINESEKASIRCWTPTNSFRWISGDIVITVSYRPSYYLWRQTRVQRFVSEVDADGVLTWFEQPLNQ